MNPCPSSIMSLASRSKRRRQRRGNAIILVSALLVLLVLIATVFLTRMRGMRQAASAHRTALERDNPVEGIANTVTSEIVGNLFSRPLDYDTSIEYGGGKPPDQGRRTVPQADAPRHGRDPFFAWNHAPFRTAAWTNPPDWLTWPMKPGPLREMTQDGIGWSAGDWTWQPEAYSPDPDSVEYRWPFMGYLGPQPTDSGAQVDLTAGVDPTRAIFDPAENPLGDPGIADSRFLRDLEPQRVGSLTRDYESSFDPGYDPFRDLAYAGGRMADVYSHWRHMSYIPAPWNGWRLVRDIADVTGVRTRLGLDGTPDGLTPWADGRIYYGGLLDRLDIPVEQFPRQMPTVGDGSTRLTGGYDVDGDGVINGTADADNGTAIFLAPDDQPQQIDFDDTTFSYYANNYWDHWDRMRQWFTPLGWRQATLAARMGLGNGLPVNLYRVADLDGDGIVNEPGERPSDEFIKDTSRWHVGRTLVDTDGDGMTDSYWYLVPDDGADGTRRLVGVSVTDNTGRLNVNTATRFFPYDRGNSSARYNSESTRGRTPVDVAMVGQNYAPFGANDDTFDPRNTPTWNVGFFDGQAHQPIFHTGSQSNTGFTQMHPNWSRLWSPFLYNPWDPASNLSVGVGWTAERWQEPGDWTRSLLGNLGLRGDLGYPDGSAIVADINDRDNREYHWQASAGHDRSASAVTTPFTVSDELELRAYEGNNMPWLQSRLERATGVASTGYSPGVHALHAQSERAESVEGFHQLSNKDHVAELRHRLTTVNGARNDMLPPHLWWESRAPKPDPRTLTLIGPAGGSVPTSQAALDRLWDDAGAHMREKLDLRAWQPQVLQQDWLDQVSEGMLDSLGWYRRRTLEQRLAPSLMLALTGGDVTSRERRDPVTFSRDLDNDGTLDGGSKRQAYHGYNDLQWEQTRRTVAALAQSIESRRWPRIIPANPNSDPNSGHGGTTLDPGPYPIAIQDPATPEAINRMNRVGGARPLPVFMPGMDPRDGSYLTNVDPSNGQQWLMGLDLWNDWPQKEGDPLLVGLSSAPGPNFIEDAVDLSDAGGSNVETLRRYLNWQATRANFVDGSLAAIPAGPWASVNIPTDVTGDGLADLLVPRPAADLFKAAWDPHVFVQKAEPQPMIGEVFVAHVGRPWCIPGDKGTSPETFGFKNSNEWLMVAAYGSDDRGPVGNGQDNNGSDSPFNPPQDCDDLDDFIEPSAPVTVMAVQLLNPFDVPIRLFDYNPSTGLWDLPRFSLKFLRPDRFDPESTATYEIVLAPNSPNNPSYNATQARIEPLSNGLDDASPNAGLNRFGVGDLGSPWYLPPATDDRPYALTIVLNGAELIEAASAEFEMSYDPDGFDPAHNVIDNDPDHVIGWNELDELIWAAEDGVSDEAEAWLDFLDLLPSEQPFGDIIVDPGHPGLNRVIAAGDMVWRIVPQEILQPGSSDERLLPLYASDWYDKDAGPDGSLFKGPTIDPDIGVGVELVRKVYLDPDGNLQPNDISGDGFVTQRDAVDVVVDRTVGKDGKDELAVVLTDQMARFRMPSFLDLNGAMAGNFVPQPGDQSPVNFPMRGAATVGNGVGGTPDLRYAPVLWEWPAALNDHQGDTPFQDPDANGRTALPAACRIDPYFARWTQWARYARPWSVDDFDLDTSTDATIQYPQEEHLALLGRQLARPDRRGPRFALADGRVTSSWSRDAAIGLGTMPQTSGAPSGNVDAATQLARRAPVVHGVVRTNAAVLAEDPLLVDANLPPVDPVDSALLLYAAGNASGHVAALLDKSDVRDELVRRLRSRRYAEQCVRLGPISAVADTIALSRWMVNDGDASNAVTPREVGVGILNDPRSDLTMPYNWAILPSEAGGDALSLDDWPNYEAADFVAGVPANEGWGVTYDPGGNVPLPPSVEPWAWPQRNNPVGVGSTYHDSLGWNNGRFFDSRWDPEGLGRYDFDNNQMQDAPVTEDSWHTFDQTGIQGEVHGNPYGYPWLTRTTRLPWRMQTVSTQTNVAKAEYHGFRCNKPHAFGFGATLTSRGRDNSGQWRTGSDESGWGGAMSNNGLPWSFADKGLYGFREIDGDVLMPSGFQLPSTHIHNYEQVGEVLDEMAAGTELWLPIASTGPATGLPLWPGVTYSPQYVQGANPGLLQTDLWPPEPALPSSAYSGVGGAVPLARRTWPVTLRTLPEWMAQEGHGGRLSLHGSQDDLNVVVGASPVNTEALTGIDPEAPGLPDWILDSDDPRHLDPGQPAGSRIADLFVCDGPGLYDLGNNALWIANGTVNRTPDGFPDDERWGITTYQALTGRDPSLRNAGQFLGGATPGMININTAPVEVLRSLPHMTRLVHASPDREGGSDAGVLDSPPASDTTRPVSRHPRSALPEAMVQYRDGLGTDVFARFPALSTPAADGSWTVLSGWNRDLVGGYSAGASYADRGRRFHPFGSTGAWNMDDAYGQLGSDVIADHAVRTSDGTRGFATIGQLFNLRRPAMYDFGLSDFDQDGTFDKDRREGLGTATSRDAWRIDFAARNPFGWQANQVDGPFDSANPSGTTPLYDPMRNVLIEDPGAFLSTDTGRLYDVQHFNDATDGDRLLRRANWVYGAGTSTQRLPYADPIDPESTGGVAMPWGTDPNTASPAEPRLTELLLTGDRVAGDKEEAAMLFAGISNLITTRSDVFTVHLKIRTFKQHPETGVWDATDPDQIIDDSRYVMVVDRGNVDHPGDKGRVLLMEKIED